MMLKVKVTMVLVWVDVFPNETVKSLGAGGGPIQWLLSQQEVLLITASYQLQYHIWEGGVYHNTVIASLEFISNHLPLSMYRETQTKQITISVETFSQGLAGF